MLYRGPERVTRTTPQSSCCYPGRSRRTEYSGTVAAKAFSRRHILQFLGCVTPFAWQSSAAAAELQAPSGSSTGPERCRSQLSKLPRGVCYAQEGPLQPLELPHLEHICTSCFPACVGDTCILNINVTYPKGGSLLGITPPYPLAVFSGGFTVNSGAYKSTAARLASWGYTVIRYDTRDALPDVLDDVTCVRLQRELIDWAATHPLMRRLADTRRVYLAGHSRGGKLAALTAAADNRVAALCLLDPVDVTQYAPLSDRFPSAAAALSAVAQTGRFLPVVVVGSGQSGDCAPRSNNYESFFQASPSAAWKVLLPAAGHFQYLDQTSALQRAVCGGAAGAPDDEAVRQISQAALVAWGETMVKLPGRDVLSCLAARCGSPGLFDASVGSNDTISSSSSSWPVGWIGTSASFHTSSSGSKYSRAHNNNLSPYPASTSKVAPQLTAGNSRTLSAEAVAAQQAADAALQKQHVNGPQDRKLTRKHSKSPMHVGLTRSPEGEEAVGQQQQQQKLNASPVMQTRQEVWQSSKAPSPVQLMSLKVELERMLVAVMYQSSATLDIRTHFRNFGS